MASYFDPKMGDFEELYPAISLADEGDIVHLMNNEDFEFQ